jgi:hypothetical protein
MKYDPDNIPWTMQQRGGGEQRRKRNRESAAASRQRQRAIAELEIEVGDWKDKYDEMMSKIRKLEDITGSSKTAEFIPTTRAAPAPETQTVTPRASPTIHRPFCCSYRQVSRKRTTTLFRKKSAGTASNQDDFSTSTVKGSSPLSLKVYYGVHSQHGLSPSVSPAQRYSSFVVANPDVVYDHIVAGRRQHLSSSTAKITHSSSEDHWCSSILSYSS